MSTQERKINLVPIKRKIISRISLFAILVCSFLTIFVIVSVSERRIFNESNMCVPITHTELFQRITQEDPIQLLKEQATALPSDNETPTERIEETTIEACEEIVTESYLETEHEEPITQESFYYDVPISQDLQDYIFSLCDSYSVPIPLIIGMIEIESGFDSSAHSDTNDWGLMQINEIVIPELDKLGITTVEDLLDPYKNVQAGIYIISRHLNATNGDTALALMRYNCGATGAKRLWNRGIYSTSYTEKVLKASSKY